MTRRATWLGRGMRSETRPVQGKSATAEQIAETALAELADNGYLVSFYEGDCVSLDTAVKRLSEAVLAGARERRVLDRVRELAPSAVKAAESETGP